jgi:hypothetical protein
MDGLKADAPDCGAVMQDAVLRPSKELRADCFDTC